MTVIVISMVNKHGAIYECFSPVTMCFNNIYVCYFCEENISLKLFECNHASLKEQNKMRFSISISLIKIKVNCIVAEEICLK